MAWEKTVFVSNSALPAYLNMQNQTSLWAENRVHGLKVYRQCLPIGSKHFECTVFSSKKLEKL